MHTGRIGHKDNLPEGEQLVSPSDIKAAGQIFTDTLGLQEFSSPVFLTTEGVKRESFTGRIKLIKFTNLQSITTWKI